MADERRLDIKVGMDSAQLSQDIKAARDNVRTFATEVKKADAEMRSFGKSSDTLAQKKKSLTSQLSSQEKQMELLNKAYEEQVSKSGKTSVQSQKLERDINNLGAEMAKTQGKIDSVTNEIADFAESSDGAGDSTIDLYNNITKSNDELKTSESRLKTAESAVKLYGASNDTLKDKLGALAGVQESQKTKMEALTAAYDREVSKSGESSAASQKLAAEMGNLQAAMNNTQVEIDKTTQELSELGDEAPQVEQDIGQVKEALQGLIMEKVIDFLTRVGDKLLELGKNALESSADLQAHNQLWGQVFSTVDEATGQVVSYSDEAKQALKEVADESGVMSTAMEKGFIKANQQFLSIGTDKEQSLKQAADLMLYSADAAAAYNVDLDAAQGSLQSFVKGNNSAAESVGIFARETQMLQFAVERGYIDMSKQQEQFIIDSQLKVDKAQQKYNKVLSSGKATATDIADAQNNLNKAIAEQEEGLKVSQAAWTGLDESIKQAVRVEYIENAYEMGKVLGTAATEADQWENVTRSLEESQRLLNAALGEAAIELLIPVVQELTKFIIKLTEWFNNLGPEIKKVVTIIAMMVIAAAKVVPFIMGIANTLSMLSIASGGAKIGLLAAGKSLIALLAPVIAAVAAIAALIAIITKWDDIMAWGKTNWPKIFKPLEAAIESIKTVFSELWSYIIKSFEGMFDGVSSIWDTIVETISNILTELKGVIEAILTPILTFINENQELILGTFKRVWDLIMLVVKTAIAILGPIIVTAWVAISDVITTTLDFIKDHISIVMDIIVNVIKLAMQIINGDWSGAWESIKNIVSGFIDLIVQIITGAFDLIVSVIKGALTIALGIIIGIFNGIATFTKSVWDTIGGFVKEAWKTISDVISLTLAIIKLLITTAWDNIKKKTSEVWEGIKSVISSTWDGIKEVFDSIGVAVDNVIAVFQGLWDKVIEIFDGIKNKITGTWESVKDTLDKLNPFGAEHKVDVIYDSDPYSFNPAVGFPSIGDTGGMIGGAIAAINSSVSSIRSGINSTFNGINDLYDAPTTKSGRGTSTSGGGSSRDQTPELLMMILEAIIEGNNRGLDVDWNDHTIAKLLYKPLKRYENTIESRGAKSRGEVSY